jgi:hypothetical protein
MADMRNAMETWEDWSGRCRVCDVELQGRLADMLAHKHEATCP